MNVSERCTIAIASGKGGVGKTVVTANLALGLAQQIHSDHGSVVAIDMDLGCGNLNTCLGVRSPNGTLDAFISKKMSSLKEVLTSTEQENLNMICASYSGLPPPRPDQEVRNLLLDEMNNLDADFVLMDLGAGTSEDVMDLFLDATEKIVVINPESLSLHNAFVFLKIAIFRFLWRELEKQDFRLTMNSTLQKLTENTLTIPSLIEKVREHDRYSACVLVGLIDELKIKFVVNKYGGENDAFYIRKFQQLLFKHLRIGHNVSYVGFVHFDSKVLESVQRIKPFLLYYPDNQAARDFLEIAGCLIHKEGSWSWGPSQLFAQIDLGLIARPN